jgi:hypothetical protein
MNAVPTERAIVRRNREGVILNYGDPTELRPYQVLQKQQPGDGERCAIIRAEDGLIVLEIIFEHLDLAEIARTRVDDELCAIYRGLQVTRRRLGMPIVMAVA